MSKVTYVCGCSITQSAFGERRVVLFVHHCQGHRSLFSETKTLRQMADEIVDVALGRRVA